jgi:MFS family permease
MVLFYICTSCASSALLVPAYYIPLFFQFTRGDSPIDAAVRLMPLVILAIFSIMLQGGLMPVVGYYMPFYLASGIFIVIGSSLMFTVGVDTDVSNIYGYSALLGIGAGLAAQASYSVAAAKVKPGENQYAVNYINLAQIGSIVISLTIAGTIFQNLAFRNLQHALGGQGFSAAELRAAVAGTKSVILENSSPLVKELAVKAIVDAMKKVYVAAIAAGGTEIICSLFLKREKLFLKPGVSGD